LIIGAFLPQTIFDQPAFSSLEMIVTGKFTLCWHKGFFFFFAVSRRVVLEYLLGFLKKKKKTYIKIIFYLKKIIFNISTLKYLKILKNINLK